MTDVRERPRARLNAAHHGVHVTLLWVMVLLLWAGGVSVSHGSGTEKLLGALAIVAGVVLATLTALYLRRPVHR